jgi:argonaute-like protein implicated in RNA metabolism and viral defense
MINEPQIGDLVQLVKHIALKNQDRYKADQLYKPSNVYGIITELSKGYYDDKVIYYTVMWLTTGESYKYEAEELAKVTE